MRNRKLLIALASVVVVSTCPILCLGEMSVTTSLEKHQFQRGEWVTVTTTLRNLSTNSVSTKAPRATSFAVLIRFEKQIEDGWQDMSMRTYSREAEIVELQAGQSTSQSCELLIRARDMKLEPSTYRVWSVYHPHALAQGGTVSTLYNQDVVESAKVEFNVVETSESERVLEEEFDEIADEENATTRVQRYWDFLTAHPGSIWRLHAFNALDTLIFQMGNSSSYVDFLRRYQNEGISTCLRELLKVSEAEILKELDRRQEALAAIESIRTPEADRLRWQIQEGL